MPCKNHTTSPLKKKKRGRQIDAVKESSPIDGNKNKDVNTHCDQIVGIFKCERWCAIED